MRRADGILVTLMTLIQCQIACDRKSAEPQDDPVVQRVRQERQQADDRRKVHLDRLQVLQDQLLRSEIAARSAIQPEAFRPTFDELTFAFEKFRETVDERVDAQLAVDIASTMRAYREMLDQWRLAFTKVPAVSRLPDAPFDPRESREQLGVLRERGRAIAQFPESIHSTLANSEDTRKKISAFLEKSR